MGERVVVAMSGGLDSSVAAYLLKKNGFDVVGITLKLYPEVSRCCRLEDIEDARRVAHFLDIPHYVFDFTHDFKKKVVHYFTREYLTGRTPNPCVICNHTIKFGQLLRKIGNINSSYIATGHYARVVAEHGGLYLARARDKKKSQEYFLAFIPEEALRKVMFPLGDYTKEHIKNLSLVAGLPLRPKKESQEVCFVPSGNYADFIQRSLGITSRKGTVLNSRGQPVGIHKGFFHYTIGQRKGIGIRASFPYYVTGIDPVKNVVVVGPKEEAYEKTITVDLVFWGKGDGSFPLIVKIRYRHDPASASVEVKGTKARVTFAEPQFAPAPGQIAVFYKGNKVVGSGKIVGALKRTF